MVCQSKLKAANEQSVEECTRFNAPDFPEVKQKILAHFVEQFEVSNFEIKNQTIVDLEVT